jgi:ankyrin repeat protein
MFSPNRISAILDDQALLDASYPEASTVLEAILENDETMLPDIDINIQDALGQTPLYLASNAWNLDFVKLFLSKGADPNICDHQGNNALHAICFRDHYKITPKGVALYCEIIKMLVDKGVYINHRNKMGATPLFVAVSYNDMHAIELLLQLGADPRIPDNEGKLPVVV